MAYLKGTSEAIRFLRELGIDDPCDFKLSDIAYGAGVFLKYKPIENCLGRIVFRGNSAIVSINSKITTTTTARYVLAHELGHFFMHRSEFLPHLDSEITLDYFQKGKQEKEANDFASELLIPAKSFKEKSLGSQPSLRLFKSLSEDYKVSQTSILFKYVDHGSFPVLLVCSQKGIVKFWKKSEDFRFKVRDLIGLNIPFGSMAYSINKKEGSYFENVRTPEIRKSTWFELDTDEVDGLAYEFCLPNVWNDSLYSLIWVD